MPALFPDGLPAVLPATVAQIQRRLPTPGDIKVRMGMRVEPDDIVGQCTLTSPPILLDVAGALGIEPSEMPNRLRPAVGSHVAFRDVLARRGRRTVLAPFGGIVTEVDMLTGFVILTPDPHPMSVSAAIAGYVATVENQQTVTIETAAALVQGLVGCGPEQWGLLRLLVTDPTEIITPDLIDARSAFTLIIGGAGITAAALRKAQAEQVRGVIVGSILPTELRQYLGPKWHGDWQRALTDGSLTLPSPDAPTLLVTEGFGTVPMSRPIFDLLTRFDRQEALLQGQTRLTPPVQRPRLVVPIPRLPGGEAPPLPSAALQVGTVVRLQDDAHNGSIGRVVAVHARERLPSGVRTATATVQIAPNEQIMLPQSVLHVLDQGGA